MKKIILIGLLLVSSISAEAQIDDFRKQFDSFKQQTRKDFDDFRSRCNHEFAEFLRKAWEKYEKNEPLTIPEDPVPEPPVVIPKEEEDKPIKNEELPIKEEVKPAPPAPQPQPVEPIEEKVQPKPTWHKFTFYGTTDSVRLGEAQHFTCLSVDGNSLADLWEKCGQSYDNAVFDCLQIRKKYNLCDWAYLKMLESLSDSFFGKGTNEATFLMAFLYCQSGYQMRLANDGSKLLMLYGSQHVIYGNAFYTIGDLQFYAFGEENKELGNMYVCDGAFYGEKPLSLYINDAQDFTYLPSENRVLKSERYPEIKADVCVNTNQIQFYGDYPTSYIGGDFMTRWAMYANVPLDEHVTKTLYPVLRKEIEGKTELEKVERLLNFVQTALEYGYDDEIWGNDRAFFSEESLYYPKCDCEDHAILFSRLVRDLVGLNVMLVYYPGHLASAVEFTTPVTGDWLRYDNNRRFTICDPTYIGAKVGRSMPDLDDSGIRVIVLEK